VLNALHFQVETTDGEIVARYTDAFTYDWRLWSVPELREAMREAEFERTEVHDSLEVLPRAVSDPSELKEDGVVCVVGRVG
jgi:hypothetical protein